MDQDYIRDEREQERRRLIRLELKRKHQNQQRIVLAALAVILVLIIVLIARGCANRQQQVQVNDDKTNASDALQQEVQDITATLTAVGDIMCYDNQMAAALQPDGTYRFAPSFAAIKPYLETSNLTVGNLELNFFGKDAGYTGFPKFNAPETLAEDLKNAGFDILQTANTYSLQGGINGLTSTIRYLTEQGIDHLGTYHTEADKSDDQGIIMKNVNGIRFAFLGYTKGMNNMTLPADADYAVDVLFEDYNTDYSKINKTGLLASVQAAKDLKADVIIAMLHWGVEYDVEPMSVQNEIADFLFANGVDVILGSHSHEVGPMEKRTVTVDGKEKEVFIAYSLGNFFSSMDKGSAQTSVVLNLEFTMDAETGKVTISDTNYLPIYLADNGENAAVRYEILPIRTAMSNSTFAHMTDTFTKAIETLKTNTASEFDSGK